MFSLKRETPEPTKLDERINDLIDSLAGFEDGSEEQAAAITALKTLTELRAMERQTMRRPSVSPDVLVSAVASLAGIIAILSFEKANVVTSKALSFVPKPKI